MLGSTILTANVVAVVLERFHHMLVYRLKSSASDLASNGGLL
jgi:hypothetical protein